MPIPKPLISDSELQARMSAALMAWRRIAHRTSQAVAAARKTQSLPGALVALADTGEMTDDLEKIAHAFDAWPAAIAHIQDLRAELAKVPAAPAPAPDLSPPWVLFTDKRKPVAILPAMRPGEVADVRGLDPEIVQKIVDYANGMWELLREAKLERLFSDMRRMFNDLVPADERAAKLDKIGKLAGVDRGEVERLLMPAPEGLCKHGNPEATMYCLDCMSERPWGPCGRCGGPTLDCVVDSLCPKCDPIKTREQTLEEAKEVFRSTRCGACGGPKCIGESMCDNCGLKAARAGSPK